MENVNHPNHYQKKGHKECIEEMRDIFGDRAVTYFCLTNAYKYLYRAGSKEDNPESQDIAKANWYYKYVKEKLYSYIQGPTLIKLYRYLKTQLEKE